MRFFVVLCLAVVLSVVFATIDTASYTIWTIPEQPQDITVTKTLPGAALIGGGRDCVPAFEWMISHASQGDFVVLRASGSMDYNVEFWELSKQMNKPLNSVTTILFKDRDAAFDPVVQQILRNAEGIFFAGGDQSLYLKFWKNSPVQDIIQSKLINTTIGGTSAGLAIQGNWIFSAETGSAYSDESMLNPYNLYVTLQTDFLKIPYLESFITDTHFSVRDRMGRMLSFAGRIWKDYQPSNLVHAIGVDETTAVLLDTATGDATIVGEGHAYLCSPKGAPTVCLPDTELTYEDIPCIRFSGRESNHFSFSTMSGDGINYVNSIVRGKYVDGTLPYGPVA